MTAALPALAARLGGAFAVHPHGETPVMEAVEADLSAQARRRARVVAWAGLLVNLPLFYVDEWLSLQSGHWAASPAYHWGLLGWRVVAVVSLAAYLVWDRRAERGPEADRRLASALGAWFVLLGGAFGVWFEINEAALPLYAFTLLLVAALIHPPTRAVPAAMAATVPVVMGGAFLYGTPAEVLVDWVEFPLVVTALALVVDRSIYRQAYRNAEGARLLERANGRLSATLDELRATQGRLVEAERQAERTRISRDLHDSVGAQLSSLLAGVELARLGRQAAPEAPLSLDDVEADVREALGLLRETVWALNEAEITVDGLATQLHRFAEGRARRAGMRASVRAEGDLGAPLSATHALQLYRIGQEAVQNAIKHSGGQRIRGRVCAEDGGVVLRVEDDGAHRPPVAADGAPSGFGMRTMRDRAEALGGSLDVATEGGTTVEVRVPLRA